MQLTSATGLVAHRRICNPSILKSSNTSDPFLIGASVPSQFKIVASALHVPPCQGCQQCPTPVLTSLSPAVAPPPTSRSLRLLGTISFARTCAPTRRACPWHGHLLLSSAASHPSPSSSCPAAKMPGSSPSPCRLFSIPVRPANLSSARCRCALVQQPPPPNPPIDADVGVREREAERGEFSVRGSRDLRNDSGCEGGCPYPRDFHGRAEPSFGGIYPESWLPSSLAIQPLQRTKHMVST